MTRVSLKEAYDNKDVVAQIYAIRDIAEGAEDTADSAVTTANTASAHVDALVPQVEGAVQNANNASASAQASAQTVAGYENRLSAVEGEVSGLDSDLGAVELRVTTAEGQIVTIQGRVTALETADGQNVKINNINEYAVGLTGNQDFYGNKDAYGHFTTKTAGYNMPSQTNRVTGTGWVKMYESSGSNHPVGIFTVLPRRERASPGFGIIACGGHHTGTVICKWLSKDYVASAYLNSIMVSVEQDLVTIWAKNISATDCTLMRDIGTAYNGVTNPGPEGFAPSTDKTIYTMTEESGVITGYVDNDQIVHSFILYEISS